MSELFLTVINMSLSASWLILAVLILRLLLQKAPKWLHVLLWGMVAIRLICPFSIESVFSLVPQSLSDGEVVSEWADDYVGDISIIHEDSIYYEPAITAGREPIYDGEGGYYVVTAYDQLGEPATVENTVVPVLAIVWIVGTVCLCMYSVVSYGRLHRQVATAVRLRKNIFQSENVESPFVLGLVRPRIYLPFKMDEQDMAHVIAHEETHIRRKDHWWKPLGFLLLTIHWFNPLMWLAYVLLCRDIELACDEKVIKELGNEQRADYSQALLSCSVNRKMIAACPLAFGEVGVKQRVKSVLHYKKPGFLILVASVLACGIIAVCFLTNPKQEITEETVGLEQYRTDYIGDASKVTAIAQGLPYPEGYSYHSISLQTAEEPYELMVHLTGDASNSDFKSCADIAFELIGNMGVISFWNAESGEVIATFERDGDSGEATLREMASYLELAVQEKEMQEMLETKKESLLEEYDSLLEDYTLLARESTDGKDSYIIGVYNGKAEENPLKDLRSFELSGPATNRETVQLLYQEEKREALEKELENIQREVENGYAIWDSNISYTSEGDLILIQPKSSETIFSGVWNRSLTPKGREYIVDAASRGILLGSLEEPYLQVYLISEKYGEISESIPLTEAEANAMLTEERQALSDGYGFAAALHMDENYEFFTQMTGVPQSVLDLAVEKCGYKFATPASVEGKIVEARLDCDWLDEPLFAEESDLERLSEILTNAKYDGAVSGCGFGAKLTVSFVDGEVVLFKGSDGCDTMVFGSYGGYVIGEDENTEFWEMFGLDVETKELIEETNTQVR